MQQSISEMLKRVSEAKGRKEKIDLLRSMSSSTALMTVLKYAFDPKIEFILPDTAPPYKPSDYPGLEGRLHSEARILYLFVKGGNPNLSQVKREMKFIELLESIHPEDAKLLLGVKDKKIPYKGITPKLVKEAFPGLIDD